MKREHDPIEEKLRQFPRHTLSDAKQKEIHEALMRSERKEPEVKRNPRQNSRFIASFAAIAAVILVVVLASNYSGMFSLGSSSKDYDHATKSDSALNESASEDSNSNSNVDYDMNDESYGETETDITREIEEVSQIIIESLAAKDIDTLVAFMSAEKGLLFSPYVFIEKEAVVLKPTEVSALLTSEKVYNWGQYDGSGLPIKLTGAEYIEDFLRMDRFLAPTEVRVDDAQERGNTVNNITTIFPDAHVIEYFSEGTEANAFNDWESLLLVYELSDSNELVLLAIVRDMWTN